MGRPLLGLREATGGSGTTDIQFPELPEGFDTSVSYPFAGSDGSLTVQSVETEIDAADGESSRFSTSEPVPITF